MKKQLKKLMTLCLICVLVISCFVPAAGAISSDLVSDQTNYEALVSNALTADGANSELVAAQLGNAFDSDNTKFISAMTKYTSEEIETIAYLLVYGKTYGDINSFKSTIESMIANTEKTAEISVLNTILDTIKYVQFFNEVDLDVKPPIEAPKFDAETILNFIALNEATGNVDEEFFNVLGNAYRADPELFADTISQRSTESIEYIAKAIAYDCLKNNEYAGISSAATDTINTESDNAIVNIIEAAIADESNSSISAFYNNSVLSKSAQISPMSTQIPTIGTMTYTTAPLTVGTSENLNVTFTEASATSVTRSYWTEIYCVKNGTAWLKTSGTVTIPAGSSSTTKSYSITFSDPGAIYTQVKVYSSNGGTQLASRQGANPDTITGKWKITVSLPSTRTQFGTLTLYNANSVQQVSYTCLGLSASGGAMTQTNGNTPTGTYTGYLYGPVSPSSSYGPYQVVNMTGVSGIIISSGRSGIWIHGGDAASSGSATYPLRPTNGCVRISNSNQIALKTNIDTLISGGHDSTGNITISQY